MTKSGNLESGFAPLLSALTMSSTFHKITREDFYEKEQGAITWEQLVFRSHGAQVILKDEKVSAMFFSLFVVSQIIFYEVICTHFGTSCLGG